MAGFMLEFAKQPKDRKIESTKILGHQKSWHMLVVDDDPGVHDVTKLILSDFNFDNRPLKLTHAYSAKEAQKLLEQENQFSVLLLDVVMENEHAGLDLVNHIRNVQKNQLLRIVLRTGQPGQAPELSVIANYDINDYREKSELTADKMTSCLTTALRSYRDLNRIQELAQTREKLQVQICQHNNELLEMNNRLEEEIRRRAEIELELASANEKFKSIINNSLSIITLKDINGRYDLVNKAFIDSLIFKQRFQVGNTDEQLFSEEVTSLIKHNDMEVINSKQANQCEEILPTREGDHFFLCVKFPLFNDDGSIYRICSISTDITDRLEAQNEILHLAQYDPLTDLPNRSLFVDRVNEATKRCRWNNYLASVLFIDLDRFKNINDTLGHDVGDKLLKEVAKRLKSATRAGDSVCRLGGDEFAVLLKELSHEHDIIRVADIIMKELSQHYFIDNRELIVTPSIGISRCPSDGTEVNMLMKKADVAMYKVKKDGRNNYRFYSKDDDSKASEQLALEVDMRKMLERDGEQLFLLYQPKVNIQTGDIDGVEALIRWKHPKRGVISPAEFIPLLEETGLILDVDTWVLKEACNFAVRRANSGNPTKVAVNLSSRQFKQEDFIRLLKSTVSTTQCAPELLELEVTESSLVDDINRTRKLLEDISQMGVTLALDDFGTGYSSLNYLKRLPFQTLKIDRSFITDAPRSEQDRAIVTTIAQLALNLKMNLVAEGVETEEQYHLFKTIVGNEGYSQIQGYIFSKPVAEDELDFIAQKIKEKWASVNSLG